ncbi:MAG: hypothetical protein KGL39_16715 [Patescibacteria group bacterium]|nr:hypothetical protein [Patescibacteria group bacterium]
MALATYSDLKSSIADWMHRTDLTAVIPDFIKMAETRLSADVTARSMDIKTNLVTVASTATVATPTDMVEMRRLQIVSSYNTVLKYLSPDELSADYNSNGTGVPVAFTIVGGNIELAPIPDAAYTLELTYKQRIPALSDSNTTNWLLSAWPDAYLYGSLISARAYIKDLSVIQTYQQMYQEAVSNVNSVDWYTGTTMRVKVR